MIRYVGGKTRIAKDIVSVITQYKQPHHTHYIEPFVGGGSTICAAKVLNLVRFGYDINEDLIALYNALLVGWRPPMNITEWQYNKLKERSSSVLRTYVGYASSFGGKFFGGYARGNKRNFTAENTRRVLKNIYDLCGVRFAYMPYQQLQIYPHMLIYCDPPYAGTMGYGNTFNHIEFWAIMREWSKITTVLISEYNAPDDFTCVWEKNHFARTHLINDNIRTVERLFIHESKNTIR